MDAGNQVEAREDFRRGRQESGEVELEAEGIDGRSESPQGIGVSGGQVVEPDRVTASRLTYSFR